MDHDAWMSVPAAVRDEVDALLRRGHVVDAIHALRPCGIALGLAVDILHLRRETLGIAEPVYPPPPVDVFIDKLRGSEPQSIEAKWHRVRNKWEVQLIALTRFRGPVPLHSFNGEQSDDWPAARAATTFGAELARQLDVEFRFDSPDEPG